VRAGVLAEWMSFYLYPVYLYPFQRSPGRKGKKGGEESVEASFASSVSLYLSSTVLVLKDGEGKGEEREKGNRSTFVTDPPLLSASRDGPVQFGI